MFLLHHGKVAEPCTAKGQIDRENRGPDIKSCITLHVHVCVCVWMMDECFNFPPLESVMVDEPKMACEVRGSHQTCRQDNKAGNWAERKSGRGAGRCANVQGSGLGDEGVSYLYGMIV